MFPLLVTNFVCVGSGQVVYGFGYVFEAFSLKKKNCLPVLKSIIRVAGVNQNIEVAGCKSKTINLKKMLKSAIELKQTAKLGDSMLL